MTALKKCDLDQVGQVIHQLHVSAPYAQIVCRCEGSVARHEAIVGHIGDHTARAPNDELIVAELDGKSEIAWRDWKSVL